MEARVYNNLQLHGSLIFAKNEAELPLNPVEGQMVLMDGRHYAYTKLASNYYSWMPISVKQSSFVHSQGVASTTWTVAHNLGTLDYGIFIYDSDHNVILAAHEPTDENTITVTFNEAITGSVVVFAVTDFAATNFNATNLTVGTITLSDNAGTLEANGTPVSATAAVTAETSARIAADALLIPLTQKGAASGVATLDGSGKVPSGQIPAVAITDTYVVGSESAMLALSAAETGDVAVRTDVSKCFILKGASYSTLADWQELLTPTQSVSIPYDVVFSIYGTQTDANEQILRFLTPRAFTIPANFSGSLAKAGTAAAAQTVFTLYKNGVSMGTVTFAASGTTGTFSSTAQISVVAGDVITATGPATPDTTLANVDFVINATVA